MEINIKPNWYKFEMTNDDIRVGKIDFIKKHDKCLKDKKLGVYRFNNIGPKIQKSIIFYISSNSLRGCFNGEFEINEIHLIKCEKPLSLHVDIYYGDDNKTELQTG